jgi:hypothetical protein
MHGIWVGRSRGGMSVRALFLVFVVASGMACGWYGSGPDDDRSLTGGFYGTVGGSEKGNPFTRTVNLRLSE